MTINAAVIGCGKRFREFYLDPLLQLKKENKINLTLLYNRNIENKSDLESIFECKLTDNLDDVILNKDINLVILTLPDNLRKKIFSNINFNPKFLLSETRFTYNLSDFYKYKKILQKKSINFEIVENKFFYPYPEFKDLNLSKIISFNKSWEHHALGFLFSVANKGLGKLNNIFFKEHTRLEIFKVNFSKISFLYIFSKDKKNVDKKKGRIKIYDSSQRIVKFEETIINSNDNKKAVYQSITNLINLQNDKMYSKNYLELENIIMSLMKLMRKLKIKKINNIQIFFLKILFRLRSFF